MVGEIKSNRLLVAWGDDCFQEKIDWLETPLEFAYELGLSPCSLEERIFLESCGIEIEKCEWDGETPGMSGTYLYGWIEENGKELILKEIQSELASLVANLKVGKSFKEIENQELVFLRRRNRTFFAPWLRARIRRLMLRNPMLTDEAILDSLASQNISYKNLSVDLLWCQKKERDDLWETVCRDLDVPITRRFKKAVPVAGYRHIGDFDQKKRILVAIGWGDEWKDIQFHEFHTEIEKCVAGWRKNVGKDKKALSQFLESLGLTVEVTADPGDGFLNPGGYDIKAWASQEVAAKLRIKRKRPKRMVGA